MHLNIKYYKIKILQKFLHETSVARNRLLHDLAVNATDLTLYKRRFRMLGHLNQYEDQVIKKIYDFDTDDVDDFSNSNLDSLLDGLRCILNKSA